MLSPFSAAFFYTCNKYKGNKRPHDRFGRQKKEREQKKKKKTTTIDGFQGQRYLHSTYTTCKGRITGTFYPKERYAPVNTINMLT